jgi:hypothetical protein
MPGKSKDRPMDTSLSQSIAQETRASLMLWYGIVVRTVVVAGAEQAEEQETRHVACQQSSGVCSTPGIPIRENV